jgi:IS5 family transposase
MPLIREFVVTTAYIHDSNIDIGIPGVPNYRDKGYSGIKTSGIGGTMDKDARNRLLKIEQVRRNKRITKNNLIERGPILS